MSQSSYNLQWIAEHIDGTLGFDTDANTAINALATVSKLTIDSIGFIESTKYLKDLEQVTQGTIIIREQDYRQYRQSIPPTIGILFHSNPYYAFALITKLFDSYYKQSSTNQIHARAVVGTNVILGNNVTIGANAVIEDNATLGDNVVISANSTVGTAAQIGDSCFLHPNATVTHDCVLGSGCILHSGSVVGGDGFGLATDSDGVPIKIYHLGRVVLGDYVEIGSNSSIDRGALGDTEIQDHVKIDNNVHIGHNCIIGAYTRIAGSVGIAGSVTVGKHCVIAGQAAITNHIEIADQVIICGQAGVYNSILQSGEYGSRRPLLAKQQMLQCAIAYKHLPEMRKQLKLLTATEK